MNPNKHKGMIYSSNLCTEIMQNMSPMEIRKSEIVDENGDKIVVEEFLTGIETSILAFVDNDTIVPMVSSKDHKKVFEGETGLNTGGMGTFSPSEIYTEKLAKEVQEKILDKTLEGFKKDNLNYKGILFVGLMITEDGPKILEYNVRFGDPETQSVLFRLDTDLNKIISEILNNNLKNIEINYSKEEAIEEAKRCIQCHCDECMKSCVYLREYKKHPGLLAREIYNNTQIIMGDHQMNKPMNSCSLCGQCTVTCPNGFDMSQVCKSARENMVSTDKMPLAPHEFALMDMLFSNSEAFLCRPQPGYETCRYVFFPGCQAGAIAPDVVTKAYEDLCRRTEGGVALMLGCCGAISEWAGRYEMTEKVNEQLKQELAKLGDPMIIAGCPSCMKQLKESLGAKVTGIWEILKEIGLPGQAKGLEIPVAIHDACGARGDTQTQDTIRELLADMGCTVVNTEYSRDLSPCCGYGGLTAYANKEMADKMTEKCLERSDSPYITYCMACRDRFVREGRESRHILELLYGINAANMPDISEKRYNRLELKEKLLKNIWNEELMMEKKDYTVAYTEDAISMMDERMILKSDVERVLSDYRENQEAIFDEETKELVTRSRLGNVTFWVRFVETEEGYLVRRAYSHRMNIMKRVGQ